MVGGTLFTYVNNTGWPDFDLEGTAVTQYLIDYAKSNEEKKEMPALVSRFKFRVKGKKNLPIYREPNENMPLIRNGVPYIVKNERKLDISIIHGEWFKVYEGMWVKQADCQPLDILNLLFS